MSNIRSFAGMNLYEGYLNLLKKQRGSGLQKRTVALLPLIALLAVLLGIGAYISVQNLGLRSEVNKSQARIEALQPAYSEATALLEQSGQMESVYTDLSSSRLLFTLYPDLNREVFTKVRACAENIFTITEYGYDETTGVLAVHLNAASVNEVPKLVERLRATELFRSVHYTGYTSDSNQRYYCTVGCTLDYGTETTE